MADDNRTEKPTKRRIDKAEEKGQILRTRELPAALALLAVILMMGYHPQTMRDQWGALLRHAVEISLSDNPAALLQVMRSAAVLIGMWVLPPMLLGWTVCLGATLAQGGLNLVVAPLQPKLSRMNPVSNLGKLFSLGGLANLLKSLIPVAFIVYLVVGIIFREWSHILTGTGVSPRQSAVWLLGLLFEVAWKCGMVFLGWSAIDYFLQRFNFERGLRMSKQEQRDEYKETEGDPQIKARLRRQMRKMQQQRLVLQNMKKATVVITNPTHFAVALEYRPESMEAPVVVAKGQNLIAKKMREEALWASIPIVENPPLAQALFRAVEVGHAIPFQLYEAVAEILAFVFRAQGKAEAARAAAARKQNQPPPAPNKPATTVRRDT